MIKLPLVYNAILGRPVLYDFAVATNIWYLCMKFPTEEGIAIVRGRQDESRVVYLAMVGEEEEEEVHR